MIVLVSLILVVLIVIGVMCWIYGAILVHNMTKVDEGLTQPLSNVPFHLIDTAYVAPTVSVEKEQPFDPIEAAKQEAKDRL